MQGINQFFYRQEKQQEENSKGVHATHFVLIVIFIVGCV